MSDAIVLDVLSSSPVQLDVGDADPIAREEIAALAGRVTTVEGDVSGLSTRMGAVEGDVTALDGRLDAAEGGISTLGTTVDGIDARVEAIEADYVTAEDVRDALGGEAPTLVSGSSRAVLGDPETASWMERTTAADGAALIESVKGNTLRWNQLIQQAQNAVNANAGTRTFDSATGVWTITCTDASSPSFGLYTVLTLPANHKYLVRGKFKLSTAGRVVFGPASARGTFDVGESFTSLAHLSSPATAGVVTCYTYGAEGLTMQAKEIEVFDLTQMFGAGNEPSTVAEFEALYPLPYYPYDPGSLLPVRMEGVETVGFNQWDEVAEDGYISDTTGENVGSNVAYLRSKDYIPVLPNTDYHFTLTTGTAGGKVYYYDADKAYLSFDGVTFGGDDKTAPANARYMRFWLNYPGSYQGDLCINISDPSRNGTYEPYWSSERTIPATDLRSAGSVYDELRKGERITRVGAVDLGTLEWIYDTSNGRFNTPVLPDVAKTSYRAETPCAKYAYSASGSVDKTVFAFSGAIYVYDSAYTDPAAFKAAMSGVMLHYALATPTTTPIDPPLPMSCRTGKGGTERVMVASGTTSAPPVFATRYPLDPADLAASIAPVDGPIAKTNHQVGDLLMLGYTLCKATQVIVTGETIAIGTNVTRTTVAAELAALSQ